MRPPKPLSLPLQLHIKIQKLWGENNTIDWHLHPDVNVITGINGSGKSTLLRLLYDAFQNDFSEFEGTEIFEELMIELNEKKDRFNKKEVNEKEKLTGIITDGDIRRILLNKKSSSFISRSFPALSLASKAPYQ